MSHASVSVAIPWTEAFHGLPASRELPLGELFITLPVKQLQHLLFNINGTFQPTNSREDIQVSECMQPFQHCLAGQVGHARN